MVRHMLLTMALLGAGMVSAATAGVSPIAVQLFGKDTASAKKVEKGAVFIDGRFIPAPYTVTREGNVILINGQIASRFQVGPDEKALTDAAAAKQDPSASDDGGGVADEDGATVGKAPEKAIRAPSGNAYPRSSTKKTLDERKAEEAKAKNLKEKSSSGGFNQEATSSDAMALFEESDYTYTPPSRPEPKAVPFIRPAAAQSTKERAEASAAKKAAEAAAQEAADAAEEVKVTENFDDLSEEEIEDVTDKVTKRRALLEQYLERDCLLLLSSSGSSAKAEKAEGMSRFVRSLDRLCSRTDNALLLSTWGQEYPRYYLRKIYDNREANKTALKPLLSRLAKEAAAKDTKSTSKK